jgi:DDE superfamily endonuclease
VLLAEDETDLLLFPPLRSGWALQGESLEVPISGRNARRVIFGAMNLDTGSRCLMPRQHQRAADFQEFLRLLHCHYRAWHLALLLDEDSSHTAKASQRLAEMLSIELIWLPKRCPELNPLDHLWGKAKEVISGNKQYATIDAQVDRFLQYLESLSPWEALHLSGTLSDNFWLQSVL